MPRTSLPLFSFVSLASLLLAGAPAAVAARGDCSQPLSNGSIPAASDCLRVLQVAVGSHTCTPACMCAPKSGTAATASDALICLKKAVGQSVALACSCSVLRVHYPAGEGTLSMRVGPSPAQLGAAQPCLESSDELWICNAGVVASGSVAKPVFGAFDARGTEWKLPAPGAVDAWPHFETDDGSVAILEDFASAKLGNSRDVAVYVPPSYDENTTKRYPVLFLQDGQNVFDPATAFGGNEWQADEAMDFLSNSSGIREAIVVAPYNTASRIDEYTPTVDADFGSGGDADLYLDFLTGEVLPAIAQGYRVDATTDPWIGGSSLGGLVSLYGAWTRPADFAGTLAMSPSLFWDDAYLLSLVDGSPAGTNGLDVYHDIGTSEPSSSVQLSNDLDDLLLEKGFVVDADYRYVVASGALHNEQAWALRLPYALRFLLRDPARLQN